MHNDMPNMECSNNDTIMSTGKAGKLLDDYMFLPNYNTEYKTAT